MSIEWWQPQPPRIGSPMLFFTGFMVGLVVIVVTTWVADKAGTTMYKKGFAKPFYILGRRIHHDCIYLIVPISYVTIGTLFLLGYAQIVWQSLWLKLAFAGLIVIVTMGADVLGDRLWPQIRKNAILHHELIYSLLPAYLFTFVIHIV